MKLSSLKVGDILKLEMKLMTIYIVLTKDVLMYHDSTTHKLQWLEIICYKILKGNGKLKFNLNQITPEEVLEDHYEVEGLSFFPKKDLPLLINEPDKTIWFDRALKGEIQESGRLIYPHLKECVEKFKYFNSSDNYPKL